MENQHRQISGYRELSQEEVDLINEIKQEGVRLGDLIHKLTIMQPENIDHRWVAIGRTDLQTGIMALVRSVARPSIF